MVNEPDEGVQNECRYHIMVTKTVTWEGNEKSGRGIGLKDRHT